MNVTGYSGGEVTITCKYDEEYKETVKYFCKGQRFATCSELIKTETSKKKDQEDRFSLFDNTTAAVFTVIIRNLTEQDSGTYYCGADKPNHTDNYTEVNLKVITVIDTLSSHQSTTTKRTTTLNSNPSKSYLTSSSPSSSNGSSLNIGVSVIVILLIIGFVSSIIVFWKRRQTQDSNSASITHETGNSEAVPQMSHFYEEINNARPQTDCRTAQLPTIPSASCSTVYATQQLPINPSTSCSTVYATPHQPTTPSAPSSTVYATPHQPTTPSAPSSIVYSTPQFPTNPSASCSTVYATPHQPISFPSASSNVVHTAD
ncbi:CMRF35-like molecule 2 isoform X2 [Danio aesculapii]|nr:CMRF35-like molecule 2 isoform X2 [Danio aesculapii]